MRNIKKNLVVYYSLTGNTKKIALEIAKRLNADVDEIKDEKERKSIMGFIKSGYEAVLKKTPKIRYKMNSGKYSHVIIGTPTWAQNISSPIRTYLIENKEKIKEVSFFATHSGKNEQNVFLNMEETLSKKPKYKLSFNSKEINNGKFREKITSSFGKNKCPKVKV